MERKRQDTQPAAARILVVDDHPLIRQGLQQIINRQKDLTVCCEAQNRDEALEAAARHHPDLAIIDLTLSETSGIDLIKELHARHPEISILVLTMHDESFYAERVLRAGARGYLMKGGALEEILTAIRQVLSGEVYLSKRMASTILKRLVGRVPPESSSPLDVLSDREMRVFELMGAGLGPSETARRLHLSVKTIETHRAHIREKLKLENASELRRYAIQWYQSRDPA